MNMIKVPFFTQFLSSALSFLFLSGYFTTGNTATGLSDLAQQKGLLTRKIDSLDLVKQRQKRNGVSITEFEMVQDSLRDSLDRLREHIQTTSETNPGTSKASGQFRFFQKPEDVFDWIIIIVGIIATFSGLMLAIGVIRSFSSKKKSRSKRRLPSPPSPPQRPADNKPSNEYPTYEKPATHVPPPQEQQETDGLEKLLKKFGRKTEKDEIPDTQSSLETIRHLSSTAKETLTANDDSLETKVLEAARNGDDVAEISRRFHLSVDHVSLLLKVAGKK